MRASVSPHLTSASAIRSPAQAAPHIHPAAAPLPWPRRHNDSHHDRRLTTARAERRLAPEAPSPAPPPRRPSRVDVHDSIGAGGFAEEDRARRMAAWQGLGPGVPADIWLAYATTATAPAPAPAAGAGADDGANADVDSPQHFAKTMFGLKNVAPEDVEAIPERVLDAALSLLEMGSRVPGLTIPVSIVRRPTRYRCL